MNFKNIPVKLKANILETILTQLKGTAFEAIRYKEITTWDELKKLFKTMSWSPHSVSYLYVYVQVEISQMRLYQGHSNNYQFVQNVRYYRTY